MYIVMIACEADDVLLAEWQDLHLALDYAEDAARRPQEYLACVDWQTHSKPIVVNVFKRTHATSFLKIRQYRVK